MRAPRPEDAPPTPRSATAAWAALAATVVFEVAATLSLRWSDGFRLPGPSVAAVAGYVATVVVLSKALRVIPMSIAYVVWTGLGTLGVALAGTVLFAERLSPSSWAGVLLVVTGVVLVNAQRRDPGPGDGPAAGPPG